ncbi:MAG TPA: nucleotidyltransferase domain-containing protein [Bacteroidales bacterium]|nr:nucleotidyltransferase domain-containing protein [Bacteroidales bacterium]
MDQRAAIEIGRKYLTLLRQWNYPVKRMFLYGSYAKGNQNPDSDIDLAIFLTELPDPFQTQVGLLQLTWNFDTRVEPHPFDEVDLLSPTPVIKEILRTGIEIPV